MGVCMKTPKIRHWTLLESELLLVSSFDIMVYGYDLFGETGKNCYLFNILPLCNLFVLLK